jgi:hypothetical protein
MSNPKHINSSKDYLFQKATEFILKPNYKLKMQWRKETTTGNYASTMQSMQ